MIYIFQGCCMVCKAPCYCCKALGEACDSSCKCFGQACDDCMKAFSNMWAPIVQNPLGLYVIGTWITMILAIIASGVTIPVVSNCQDLLTFIYVDIGIAVVHMVFSCYIQRRLVNKLLASGAESMSHAEITAQATSLAKYDVAFCLYVFFFPAAFGYNVYGIFEGGGCPRWGYQKAVVALMILYAVITWHYALCWFCGQCCFGTAEKRGVIRTRGQPATLVAAQPATVVAGIPVP